MNKRLIFGLITGVIIIALAVLLLVKIYRAPANISNTNPNASSSSGGASASHGPCLADDEYADYPLDPNYISRLQIAKIPLTISIRDRTTKIEKYKFVVNNVPLSSVQLELHRCGVYVLKEFRNSSTWDQELWKYDYSGQGIKLLVFFEVENNQIVKTGPQFDGSFRIGPSEHYLALDRGPIGSSNQATIVKDLSSSSLPDVFSVNSQDILKIAPDLSQNGRSAEPIGWSSDGKYLWGISSEPDFSNLVYFRIANLDKNSLEIFRLPSDAVHLNGFRIDTGHLLYTYGPPFTGIVQETQQVDAEWQKEGRITSLFLYNLFTKKKTLIASSPKYPEWNFNAYFLSDNQFQYTPPSGATTTYTIPTQ